MTRRSRIASIGLSAGAILLAVTTSPFAWGASRRAEPFEATTMIIEFNSTDQDIGVQFFVDSEGWTSVEITDPFGQEIFGTEAEGRLFSQGGGSELFLESVEPELSDLSIEQFFRRFPAGIYGVHGVTTEGKKTAGKAVFTHAIPAGPEVTAPVSKGRVDCASNVPIPVVIAWNPVTTSIFGDPIDIKGYEVIVEGEDSNFDVHIPASAGTALTISPESLVPGADYVFEILAIEQGGNQTITEGCFSTAP